MKRFAALLLLTGASGVSVTRSESGTRPEPEAEAKGGEKTAAPPPVIATRLLDPEAVIAVPTSPGITTTLQFPSAVQGVDGAGLAATAREGVLYSISHTPGASILSVSPNTPEARTNMNVVIDGQVYVFILTADPERALFKLTLRHPPPPPPPLELERLAGPPERRSGPAAAPARLLGLIDKCKAFAALQEDDPAHVADLRAGKGPWKPSVSEGAVITPVQVYRKGQWDALVLKVSIQNSTDAPLYYDPESFLVSAGPQGFRAILTDAAGTVPPKGRDDAWIVIQGDGAQGSNNLDPDNEFQVTFQRLKEGPPLPLPLSAENSPLFPAGGGK